MSYLVFRLLELCGVFALSGLSGNRKREQNCICEVAVTCPESECLWPLQWVLVGAVLGASFVLSWLLGTACWRRKKPVSEGARAREAGVSAESADFSLRSEQIEELAKQQVLAIRRRR
eukprot:6464799-Amphidinium_carterae.1